MYVSLFVCVHVCIFVHALPGSGVVSPMNGTPLLTQANSVIGAPLFASSETIADTNGSFL